MSDLLLPRPDAGVLAQVIIVSVAFGAAALALRRRRELRVFVMGMWVMTYAAMGLRAIH